MRGIHQRRVRAERGPSPSWGVRRHGGRRTRAEPLEGLTVDTASGPASLQGRGHAPPSRDRERGLDVPQRPWRATTGMLFEYEAEQPRRLLDAQTPTCPLDIVVHRQGRPAWVHVRARRPSRWTTR